MAASPDLWKMLSKCMISPTPGGGVPSVLQGILPVASAEGIPPNGGE